MTESSQTRLEEVIHLPRHASAFSSVSKLKQFKQEPTFIKALQYFVSGSILLKCYSEECYKCHYQNKNRIAETVINKPRNQKGNIRSALCKQGTR